MYTVFKYRPVQSKGFLHPFRMEFIVISDYSMLEDYMGKFIVKSLNSSFFKERYCLDVKSVSFKKILAKSKYPEICKKGPHV